MKVAAIHCRLFPGRVLDAITTKITDEHKIAAAKALAEFVENPCREHIIPSAFDDWVANVVAEAVKKCLVFKKGSRKKNISNSHN